VPKKKLLTVREISEYTGIPETRIYELVARDQIPHVRIGNRIYFRPEAIDGWLESLEVAA
jgi:excisionase family DNA binding protein